MHRFIWFALFLLLAAIPPVIAFSALNEKQPLFYDYANEQEESKPSDEAPSMTLQVRQALMEQPEMIEDALAALEQKRLTQERNQRQTALQVHRDLLEHSSRQMILGDPDAQYTIVEFFDYNCGFCRRAVDDMKIILENRKDVRFVLKEFPVLGQDSVDAARVSIALSRQEAVDFMAFHTQLLKSEEKATLTSALEVAEEVGANMEQLQKDMQSPEIEATFREVYYLADELALNGTPTYVIGNTIMMGAVGQDRLLQALLGDQMAGPKKDKVQEEK
jgi:protein-disulfide isomerase